MIKVLPHILCRVAGMSFSELEAIGFSDELQQLNENLLLYKSSYETHKKDVIDCLKGFQPDDENFSIIRKIKKLVRKNQHIPIEWMEIEDISGKLPVYNQILKIVENRTIEFENLFEKEAGEQRCKIQQLAKKPNFQKALPLSSISFAKRLQRYLDKNPANFKKKELQTERTVMQYLARMSAKTSPFSSFTTLSYGAIRSNRFPHEVSGQVKPVRSSRKNQTNTSNCKYNNQILELFQTLFLSKIDFLSKLNIRINPTLEIQNDHYRFLINHQNIESFQTIAQQDFLAIIETYFEEKSVFMVEDLIFLIINDYEIEVETVIDFLMELVAVGFFEVDFGFNSTTENWLRPLRNYIEKVPCTSGVDCEFVDKLIQNLDDFPSADLTRRITILENSHQLINEFIQRHFNNKVDKNIRLELSPEQLIYEDVANDFEWNFDKKAVDKLINSLHDLLQEVHFLQGKERLQMTFFFKNYFGENAEISLLDFYEQYYKIGKQIEETQIPTIQEEARLLKLWVNEIGKLVSEKYQQGEVLKLEVTDLQRINKRLGIELIPLKNISLSCFAQFFEEEKELKAVINGVSAGYGKMVGRFLKLMPNSFTEDLRSANLHLRQANKQQVENIDASFFNANLHPLLFDLEIGTPNGQNQLSESQQVRVSDLKVRCENDKLVLWESSRKTKIEVLDLGIQAQKGRSPLYQLLSNFSPIIPDIQYFREAIEQGITQVTADFRYYPQVDFSNLTLLRERFIILDLAFLSNKGKSATKWQEVKKWCLERGIKSNFFLRKAVDNVHQKGLYKKAEKPIYFDINQLILLEALFRLKAPENNRYELIQTVPKVENILKIGGRKYFLEGIIQWYDYE